MVEAKFKVSMSQKGSALFIVLFVIIEAALIGMSLNVGQREAVLGIVISVMFFVVCFAAELTSLLFKVQVIDSIISVRTRIGRCYRIHISEISRIVSETGSDKEHGQIGGITIKTANRKLEMDQTMNGFQEILERQKTIDLRALAYGTASSRQMEITKKAVGTKCSTAFLFSCTLLLLYSPRKEMYQLLVLEFPSSPPVPDNQGDSHSNPDYGHSNNNPQPEITDIQVLPFLNAVIVARHIT